MVEIRSRAPIHRGWRGRMRTMLALAAAASVEGAMSGPLGTSRSRPLRLEASSAKVPELLTGVTRGLQALLPTPSVSANMDEMQRWHEEAARSRLAAAQHGAQHLRGGSDFGMMKSKPNVLTKMQNGLSSSRAAIMWVIKGLLAAFTGLLTTSAVMVAFEFTAHKVRPVTGLSPRSSPRRACIAPIPILFATFRSIICAAVLILTNCDKGLFCSCTQVSRR